MDSLKSDLKNIQSVAKDLLNQIGCELSVPSWKFPEKLGSHVDPHTLLKERERDTKTLEGREDNRLFITELIIDRLMFVLQCCVCFSDCTSGHKPINLPLTLGSTIRKFSKKIQYDLLAIKDLKKKISLKDERIIALEDSMLEGNVIQLQDSSRNEISTTTLSSTSCIKSSQQNLTVTNSAHKDFQANTLSEGLLAETSSRQLYETNNVQTQTSTTAFALCVRCVDTQDTLVDIAGSISEVCYKHNQTSSIDLTDWKGLAAVEGLNVKKWSSYLGNDLSSLDLYAGKLEQTIEELEKDQIRDREIIENLQKKIDSLNSQVDFFQVSIDEVQAHNKETLVKTQEELGTQLNELRHNFSSLQASNFKIKEELTITRRQEAQIKSRMIDLEQTKNQLQGEIHSIESREIQLLSIKQSLERALEKTRCEVDRCKEQVERDKLELSKSKVYYQSLEKKNKSLVSKQAALLSQLDDLDQECTNLKEHSWKADKYKQELSSEMVTLQTQCVKLQEEVETMTARLSLSQNEYEQLNEVYSNLEQQLSQTKNQLEEEKEKCRLLMDYPFVKQTAQNYTFHIDSLSGKESKKQISANTVRILLLEEQNTELRQKNLPSSHQDHTTSQEIHLKRPVQTWSDELLSQVIAEQTTAREVSSGTDHIRKVSSDQLPHSSKFTTKTNERIQPLTMKIESAQGAGTTKSSNSHTGQPPLSRPPTATGRFKGHLGHLVTALAESQN